MKSYNGFTPEQRQAAFNWLKVEIAEGRRQAIPDACQCCRQTKGLLCWHSEDYSFPYGDHIGEYALCFICHMMIHCRFKNRAKWIDYVHAIESGWQYCPVRGWPEFRRVFLETERVHAARVRVSPPKMSWLRKIDGGELLTYHPGHEGKREA